MMFSLSNVAALVASATMLIGAQAAPVVQPRDVWVPAILTPTTGTVWEANSTNSVTWFDQTSTTYVSFED